MLASSCHSSYLPSIDEVAESKLSQLQQNDNWRLFKIKLEPNQKLDDHRTGSRIIISLSAIKIEGLKHEKKMIKIGKYKALWLQNKISKGFKNISQHTIEYLVLEAKDPGLQLTKSNNQCNLGTTLLAFESLMVCKLSINNSIEPLNNEPFNWRYHEQINVTNLVNDIGANASMFNDINHTIEIQLKNTALTYKH